MGKKKRKKAKEEESAEEEVEEDKETESADEEKTADEEAGEEEKEEDNGIKLFGRWPVNVEIRDRGLERYINVREVKIPHFGGQFSKKRFWKHKTPIVERLATRMMNPGAIAARLKGRRTSYRAGKKQKALNIIRRAFELLHLKTGDNPLQLLINAIENAAPREDTTRISMGGISYQSSVDVAPSRRVDMAIHYLALGATRRSYNSPLTIEECLTDEILAASRGDQSSFAVSRKEEKERIAYSAR